MQSILENKKKAVRYIGGLYTAAARRNVLEAEASSLAARRRSHDFVMASGSLPDYSSDIKRASGDYDFILAEINGLDDAFLRDLLVSRYVDRQPLQQMATEYCYSHAHIVRLINKALDAFYTKYLA